MKKRFINKTYGYGRVPATRQGWAILGLYTIGLVASIYRIDNFSNPNPETIINSVLHIIILTIFLLIVAYATGEKPEWRWGKKKDIEESNK